MISKVGKVIRKFREQASIPMKAFAEQIDVPLCELKHYEETGISPAYDLLGKIASCLQVSRGTLLLAAGEVSQELIDQLVSKPEYASNLIAAERKAEVPGPIKQVFQTKLGALYRADCLSYLPTVASRSIDCVFADPPFNLGKDYGANVNDQVDDDEYLAWSLRWIDEVVRVLKPGGSFFLYNLPKWNIHLSSYISRYLTFKHWIAVDIKFSLPIGGRLYPSHYSLLFFVKGPKPNVFNPPRLPLQTCRHCGGEIKDYGGYKDKMNPQGVNITDVWVDIPPVRHSCYKNRPANELALKLMDRVLDISTRENDLVLDPFGGGGTTYAACELKGRRWLGCEMGDCQPIIERLSDLAQEREQLEQIRSQLNLLFTPESLALRKRFGHDTSRYRLEENGQGNGSSPPNQLPLGMAMKSSSEK